MGMRIASKRQRAGSLRPPLAYAADLLRVCLRDKAIAASLIACQALLLLPMIVGFPMNEEAINRDRALSMLGIVRNELSAYKDEFPEELYDLTQQQYRHYSDAVAAKYPSKEFFRAMAAASEVEDAEQRAGYLTGDNIHSAYAKLFDGLASIDGTPVYATAADLPALEYLAFALGLMPAIVVLLPAVVATTSIVRRLRGQTLLAHAPIGKAARRVVATMTSIACAAAGLAAVLMPAALVALLRNGIGDPAYPLVHIIAGDVVASSAGRAIAEDIALLALAGIALVSVMCVVGRAGATGAFAAGVALCVLPLLPPYSASSAPWAAFGAWLPTTYLRLDQVIGQMTYSVAFDISAFPQATVERGAAILACTAAATCLAGIALEAWGNARDRHHLAEGGSDDRAR